MSTRYNHAFTLGFSVVTNLPDGSDLTADDARQAIIKAVALMNDTELLENLGAPFDTYQEESNS